MPPPLRATAVVVAIVGFLAALKANQAAVLECVVAVMTRIEAMGPAGMALYMVVSILAMLVMFPTVPLDMAAGLLFAKQHGIVVASLLAGSAKITSQCLAFVLGRTLLRGFVERNLLPRFPIFRAAAKTIAAEPFKMTCVVRFAPIPTSAKSFCLSVCGVPMAAFVVASTVIGVPWSVLGALVGSTLASLPEIFDGRGEEQLAQILRPWKERPVILVAVGALAVAMLFYASRAAKHIYKEAVFHSEEASSKAE